jgi:poly-gamma-glutamate synthesis protein (capsule biosynthesis protein)
VRSAERYVDLAEEVSGSIERPVAFDYIWGDTLAVMDKVSPDVRIINLETSVTTSDDYWPAKGINYRMHPKNIPCINAAQIDCCVLANNHVLDWGYSGLAETLRTLRAANIKTAGAGADLQAAVSPATVQVPGKGRVVVFSYGAPSSGVPRQWAAGVDKPGVNFLPDLSGQTVRHVHAHIQRAKQPGDVIVVSLHWGGNWGYAIPAEHRRFAHQLVDDAGADIIHGHSSHHPIGIEVYNHKPILYGCGDFLNDYEGIGGYEQYRDDLTFMYFVRVSTLTGRLRELEMVPMQIQRFRLVHPAQQDIQWLKGTMQRECRHLNTDVKLRENNTLALVW